MQVSIPQQNDLPWSYPAILRGAVFPPLHLLRQRLPQIERLLIIDS